MLTEGTGISARLHLLEFKNCFSLAIGAFQPYYELDFFTPFILDFYIHIFKSVAVVFVTAKNISTIFG